MNQSFQQAKEKFFQVHLEDPHKRPDEDGTWSVLYHRRLLYWVQELHPEASEAMLLAACCQHIRRWKIPRAQYPKTPAGYKRWRSDLMRFHSDEAESILHAAHYDEKIIERVREFLTKRGLRRDPEVQLFEDAICLVFIEAQLASFAEKHSAEKVIDIIQKTWKKMSDAGQKAALQMVGQLPPNAQKLLGEALGK